MAGDAISPLSTCMVLFFSMLLVSHHFTMAVQEQSYSASSPNREGAKKKRNAMVVVSSARSEGRSRTEKSKKHMMALQGPKRGGSRVPRPPLQWKNKFFGADEHEVPSGPNPISNK